MSQQFDSSSFRDQWITSSRQEHSKLSPPASTENQARMCTCIESSCCCLGKRITCLALSIALTTLAVVQWSFDVEFLSNCFLVNPAKLAKMIFSNPVNEIMQAVVILVDLVLTTMHVPLAGLLAYAIFSKKRILLFPWAAYMSAVIPWQITALTYLNNYGKPFIPMLISGGVLTMSGLTVFGVAYSLMTLGL